MAVEQFSECSIFPYFYEAIQGKGTKSLDESWVSVWAKVSMKAKISVVDDVALETSWN